MTGQSLAAGPPQNAALQRALAALRTGRVVDAENLLKEVLRADRRDVSALNLLAVLLIQLGRFAEAETYLQRALQVKPKSDATLYNYGIALKALNRPAEALERFSQATAINAAVAETWNNRGIVFNDLKRHDEAIADFDKAIGLNPRYAEAFCNKATSYAALERFDDALSQCQKALELKPDLAEAWCGCGDAYWHLQRYDEASAAFDRALGLKPSFAEAWVGRGNASAKRERYDEAIADYDKALALEPDLANAWLGRGNVLFGLKRYDEAVAAYEKALALKPDLANAWHGRGNVLFGLKRYDEAFTAYDKALALKPNLESVEGARLISSMFLCDWSNIESSLDHLIDSIKAGTANTAPFVTLGVSDSPEIQLQCARLWVAKNFPSIVSPRWKGDIYKHNKIRLGYVSSDFREHPMTLLMADVFECHDKAKFETTAISIGIDDKSPMRQRLQRSFDRFLDCRNLGDKEIANEVLMAEIEILVDLNGFTQDARPGIFAGRPAPIQVNYLGYPGTMGANFIDYIIGDNTVFGPSHEKFYTEKLVRLPDSYYPHPRKRVISDAGFSRAECGLPETGFVFCCFNNNYKIGPSVFDRWMRILKHVSGSVLWLLEGHGKVISNLRKEAAIRGISPDRLIFAKRMPVPQHLARHRHADLFLDTLPYNAHTTACDALWVGLPVLTQLGETFGGRVAASLLKAVGLSELIVSSEEEYVNLAVELAANPSKLAKIKERINRNRLTRPLFNPELLTRHLESAFELMYHRYRADLAPEHIAVEKL